MPTITLSTSTPGAGFNMLSWGVNNLIFIIGQNFNLTTHPLRATQLHYHVDNGPGSSIEDLVVNGAFSNFNNFGDPTAGTVNSFQHSSTVLGMTETISVSGLSLSVPTVFNWIFTLNGQALHAAIFNGADLITGTSGDDILIGYGGADTINGGDGSDELYGEIHPGFTVYPAAAANDTLNGGAGNDLLYGGDGDDTLNGGDGNDTLLPGAGVDNIDGGAGVDSVTLDRSSVSTGLSINLTALALTGAFYDGSTVQNVENIAITTGNGDDTFTIDDAFAGSFAIGATGGTDHLIIDVPAITDAIVMENFGDPSLVMGAGALSYTGIERFTITGGSGNDVLIGGSANDVLSGGLGDDGIFGGGGDDTLNGGDGDDSIAGGAGNDTINAGDGDDTVEYSSGADQIDGGAGLDVISFDLSSLASGITFTLETLAAGLTLSTGATLQNFERIGTSTFTSGNDTFVTDGSALAGSFILNGGGGDDLFLADFSAVTAAISLSRSSSQSLLTGDFPAGSVNVALRFDRFIVTGGSGDDTLQGRAGPDTLNGGDGADRLQGYGGANVMFGGAGDDILISDIQFQTSDTEPVDSIDGGDGLDHVYLNLTATSLSYTIDLAQMQSSEGQTLANGTLVRNTESFRIFCGSGDDTFLLSGPIYSIDAVGSVANAHLGGGQGTDTLIADFSSLDVPVQLNGNVISIDGYTTSFSAENVFITGGSANDALTGSAGAQTLNGGAGNDVLNGGAGAFDVLNGDEGDDTLINSGSNGILDGGAGVDTATLNHTNRTGDNTIMASDFATATGVTLSDGTVVRNVEVVLFFAGQGNDTLIVDSSLTGGEHRFIGGGGFDRIIIDLSDIGADIVMNSGARLTTASFSILYQVDQALITSGPGNDRLLGWTGTDVLDGGDGDDILTGDAGADTLIGGAGDDTLDGGDDNDRLTGDAGADLLRGGSGIDTGAYVTLASNEATWHRNVDGTWTVASADGTDTLTSVEFLSFTDRDVFLDRASRTFSGNGTSDILFRRADGIMASWEVTGTTINTAAFLPTAGAEWTPLGAGDFNGDGRDDVIWQRSDGLVYTWRMNGGTVQSTNAITGIGAEWSFLGVGDFNGDLKDDAAWQRNDGLVVVWQMNGAAIQSANTVTGLSAAWELSGLGDFNSDGRDDFLWRNTSTGQTVIWHMDGAILTSDATSEQAGLDWAVVGVGDTNGDGRDDIIMQRASDGMIAVWAMDGTNVMSATNVAAANPNDWTVRQIGDYNGDGRDDILWQHDNGLVYVWLMDGSTIIGAGALSGVDASWSII